VTQENGSFENTDKDLGFVRVDDVQLVKELYPRDGWDNETVNRYMLNLDKLPPIVLTRDHVLVDGYHRLLAHRTAGKTEIKARFIDIPKDRVLWEAARLNAAHGRQLTKTEKMRLARIFYKNNGCTLQEISEVLAVSTGTLSGWLRNVIQQAREEQKQKIIELYLDAKNTQQEIADKIGLSRSRIAEIVGKFKIEKTEHPPVPESLQLYNVWYFPRRDPRYGLDFEGAIPGQIVENVLYYYTEPFQVVVDPMAGGGTTIDVCKAMYRRYLAYDLKPKRDDVRQHDIREGFPKEAKNCDLVFLDPPYYNMVFSDLFKDIDKFYVFINKLAKDSFSTVKDDGYVAFLMQDMTEKGRHCLTGECYRLFRKAGFTCVDHVSCPLPTEQFLPQQVSRAKTERRLLGRNRDLYDFRKVKR